MAVSVRPTTKQQKDAQADFKYVSQSEGEKLLDRQARKYLGMSGEAFVRKYKAGEIEDADRADVIRVAMLIPLAEQ